MQQPTSPQAPASPAPNSNGRTLDDKAEKKLVLLLALVQFVNVLDFMMVMPLGPKFATHLSVPLDQLPMVASSYTLSAAISGFLGAFFLDRFDRKPALVLAVFGLSIGTFWGGFAQGLPSLMASRIVAGAFGGPATSLALSVVADVIPAERRGRAIGVIMSAFSVASALGVPIGLELAESISWHAPFFAVGAAAMLACVGAFVLMPAMRGHLDASGKPNSQSFRETMKALFSSRTVLLSYGMSCLSNLAIFMLIPNISPYLTRNLQYPEANLSTLYFAGGLVTFLATRPFGILVDRIGSFRVGTIGTILAMGVIYVAFVDEPTIPVLPIFMVFMLTGSMRNVAATTLASKVPRPNERARFMSMQSVLTHLASGAGAMFSAKLLHEEIVRVGEPARLAGMPLVAWISIGVTAFIPFMIFQVEKRISPSRMSIPHTRPGLPVSPDTPAVDLAAAEPSRLPGSFGTATNEAKSRPS